MPTLRELARVLGLRSVSRAYDITEEWVKEGFVTKDDAGRIMPGEIQFYLPLLGTVEAGIAMDDEVIGKSAILDDFLLTEDKPSYIIRVNGSSMKDAGIFAGDHVVVERTEECKPGDIVIARIDGSWTIKHLREDVKGKRFLQASDDEYSKIYPSRELRIVAVVTALIRRYRS